MIKLGINGNLIAKKRFFFTDQKIEIIIDGHKNKERKIEAGISQEFPALPMIFLIYISVVFDLVLKFCTLVIAFSFVNNLGFLISGFSIKDITLTLEIIAITIL